MTNTPRVYRTNAIVLRHIRIGEADRILTLLTPYLGKIRVVAKGVLKPTSRKAGHLDLLSHTSLLIARGRNLDIVTQAQVIDSFEPLRQDVMRISRALYAAELADRFTDEGAESRQVYELLLTALNWLGSEGEGDVALRYLEMQILGHSGYRPELRHCVRCRVLLSPTANFFSVTVGGVLCPSCGQDMDGSTELTTSARPLSLNALKVLRLLQGDDPSAGLRTGPGMAQRLRMEPPLGREVEGHMRHYLTYLLERDVKSAAFLDHLRGSTGLTTGGSTRLGFNKAEGLSTSRRQARLVSAPAVGYQESGA